MYCVTLAAKILPLPSFRSKHVIFTLCLFIPVYFTSSATVGSDHALGISSDFCCLCLIHSCVCVPLRQYTNSFLNTMTLSANLDLDFCSLSQEKKELMERSRLDRLAYTPALSFFKSKEWKENTTTFKIIRKMPKGDL